MTTLLKTFYPTSCLVTGFDILFFWVARMMMMGLKFMNDVPFREVYIHALVRDELGKKMSKSLGNVIDPLMIMDKYGTDAFRFTLAALAAQGRDIRLSETRIEGYRNFMNKLWNAARFSLPYLAGLGEDLTPPPGHALSLPERWILSRLNRTVQEVRQAIEGYRFNDAAQALYHFAWHEFCDWYIEEAKIPLSSSDPQGAQRSAIVLRHVLDSLMLLLHPFIPFITEEIASQIHTGRQSIMRGPFPELDLSRIDPDAERDMGTLMGIISGVRNIRAEMNLPPAKVLPIVVAPSSEGERGLVDANRHMISSLGKVSEFTLGAPGKNQDPPRMSATAVIGDMRIFVPLGGIVDPDAEIARLAKEIAKASKDLEAVEKKLSNSNFMAKANPEAVQKQKDRQSELSAKLAGLGEGLEKMQSLKGV